MHILIKVLCLTMILKKNTVETGASEKFLPMIFGGDDGKVSVISEKPRHENPNGTVLHQFDDKITAFARYDRYIFVSTELDHYHLPKIHRCMFNWTNLQLVSNSCQIIYEVSSWFYTLLYPSHVSSMVVGNDKLFAGRTDGLVTRCSTTEKNNCEQLNKFGAGVTGIDYDHVNHVIYATTMGGTLWRCSPTTPNSCSNIYESMDDHFTSVKIAYDAVWIAVLLNYNNGAQLLKCHLKENNLIKKCDDFVTHRDPATRIDDINKGADGYLYFMNKFQVWKVHPQEPNIVQEEINIPRESKTFIFA